MCRGRNRGILRGLNFRNFLDDSWGVIRDTERLITEFGWYKGDFFRNWIGEQIKSKTGNGESTFRDIAEPESRPVTDFFSYTYALVGTVLNIQDSIHLHSDDWQRTIYIDTLGAGTTDFDIDGGKKDALIASGREGTIRYFDDWFNNLAKAVVNRP